MTRALADLAATFAELSLLAVGGANALLPQMQRAALAHHWAAPAEFAHLFALAQAAPGPNMLIVTLIGWRVGGVLGAAVATFAFVLPAALLTYAVAGAWERFRAAPWRKVVQAGLTPVTVGLVTASALVLCRDSISGPGTGLIAAASAAGLLATRLHPLWFLALGAALGAAGLLH